MLGGCAGGGGEPSTQVVSGTVAVGAALSDQVSLKDSSTPTQPKITVIADDGSFAFDVTNMKAPFILQADGHADGKTCRLHSFADGPGTANVNPLSDALVASSCDDEDKDEVYRNPDAKKLEKIKNKMELSTSELLEKIAPLLKKFNVKGRHPIKDHFKADHHGLDGVFDYVNITIVDHILTITNKNTGAIIFTGSVRDIRNGHYNDDDDDNLPQLPQLPLAPPAVGALGGAGQITISWDSVGNATEYNLYYATNPAVLANLTAGTTYYYIVAAVNSVGEGAASNQTTASTNAPPLAVPDAPTGVTLVGGANEVSVAWSAVSGATAYNIYWSTTPGVTTSATKITGAASPYTLTGLSDGTTYYAIVTAVNSAGENNASAQTSAATTNVVAPPTCGSCHAIPPATGKHSKHVTGENIACATCHGSGYSSTAATATTHRNGVKDVNLSVWSAASGSCTSYCHGNKSW